MSVRLQRHIEVGVSRRGVLRRRDFFRNLSALGLAAGACGWSDLLAAEAEQLRRQGMACILLWMQGGPSQFETFTPKPGHANGGETTDIATSVSGIRIAANLPETAKAMDHLCVIRSMTSKEGSHPRATHLMRTSYLPTASVKYPDIGAHAAQQLGDDALQLPSFVRIGQRGRTSAGGGLLGVEYDPFVVANAAAPPSNTSAATSESRYRRRLGLLGQLESDYADRGGRQAVEDHKKLYAKASRMVLSPQMDAFEIDREPASVRSAYGSSAFGSGCLLARRLVESGVSFVEVNAGNWDTHQDNAERTAELCREVDRPFARLVADLQQRGILENTLVLWMGEFGRTPRINPRGGRDHYPRAFNAVLAGGGVRGGQVIGDTDAGGVDVVDRPVTVSDLLQTVCHSLKIDADRENMSSIGRPIRVVDGGETVTEVFG